MKDYARYFYNSPQWKAVRENYKSKHPLCEDCLENGDINATEIVHHKIHLTEANIKNPDITLNEENLRAVCRLCHAKHHLNRRSRYKVDKCGRLIWE